MTETTHFDPVQLGTFDTELLKDMDRWAAYQSPQQERCIDTKCIGVVPLDREGEVLKMGPYMVEDEKACGFAEVKTVAYGSDGKLLRVYSVPEEVLDDGARLGLRLYKTKGGKRFFASLRFFG